MKKEQKKSGRLFTTMWIVLASVWVIFIIILIWTYSESRLSKDMVSWETFSETASLVVNEDKVGAKVTLKEAIHGTDGIVYRYILKTDCPSWNYEDRYATRTPISWATDDTAAVEVLIYDAQVRYEGTAYASGTYYMVPMFDGLSSEDIALEDWENKLVKQAYTTYIADADTSNVFRTIGITGTFGIPVILSLYVLMKPKKKKEEDPADYSEE